VTVTVLPRRRGEWIRRHLGRMAPRANRRLAIGLLVVSVAVGALGLAAFMAGGVGTTAASEQGQRGASASAARCLSALAALDRRRGDFDRAVWCERYAGRASGGSYRFVGAPLPAFDSSGR
jgi:hypothetical protein